MGGSSYKRQMNTVNAGGVQWTRRMGEEEGGPLCKAGIKGSHTMCSKERLESEAYL